MTGFSPLARFLLLYGALFAAFGVVSPFLPGLLMQDGLGAAQIGVVLAAGTAVRLVAGPLGGRLADWSGRTPAVLTGLLAASAAVATGYAPARGLALLVGVSVAHAIVLAPLTPLADALALGSARGTGGKGGGFPYGWVRGMGSGAFIAGTLLSGQLVGGLGLGVVVWLNAGLLAAAALCAPLLPNRVAGAEAGAEAPGAGDGAGETRTVPKDAGGDRRGAWRALVGIPVYVRLMVAAALVVGSHAMHDGFEVIRWRTAGLSASEASVLWALSVAGEVLMFLLFGRRLLERLGPGRAVAVSAVAGVVRWGAAARTAWFPLMAAVEPLHGLTFALLHLAVMDVIARTVPARHAAVAQAVYATVATGAATALVTLLSGPLYGRFGAGAFWAMAAMCLLALPVALGIRLPAPPTERAGASAVRA